MTGPNTRMFLFIVRKVVTDPRYFHESGYRCPYCGYRGRQNTPLSAYKVAIHVYREHSAELREEILWEMDLA